MAPHFDLGVRTQGQKRPAESDPDGDQPLTKKFGRLHIGIDLLFSVLLRYLYSA